MNIKFSQKVDNLFNSFHGSKL